MTTLIVIAVISFLFWYVPRYSLHSIKATSMCNDIYKSKFPGYFGEQGVNRYIFSKDRNSCLLLNTLSDTVTFQTRYVVIDMVTDDILFLYDLKKDEVRDANLHLTKDEALDKVRTFGFLVF